MLRRLFRPPADGQAHAVEAEAMQAGGALAADVGTALPPHRAVSRPETVIQAALAQKTLHGWMQNRYQTRYPLVLNLRNHAPAEVDLLLQTVRHCLRIVDPGEDTARRASRFIAGVGGALELAPADDGTDLVGRLHAARLVPQAYAACAGALGRRTTSSRRFLEFLAARLDLPDDVARSINRRFAN